VAGGGSATSAGGGSGSVVKMASVLRGAEAALNIRDAANQLLIRDETKLNSGATCDVYRYQYPQGPVQTSMSGQWRAVKKIEHGLQPHQCKLKRADLVHLANALNEEGLCRTQVVPAGVSPSGIPQTALVMELGESALLLAHT
jgi:hypothetical protein